MRKIILFIIITLLITSCVSQIEEMDMEEEPFADRPMEASEEEDIKVTSNGVKYLVHPSKIIGGGPPKDGIPSIDDPKFVTVKEADEWIQDNELVLAIIYKGIKRVYPLQIMVWHEIVNDNIAGDPILITYCPLCGSGIAYERKINGEEVEFGTSGKLFNSNLVMYDRRTDSYWTQIDGLAIVGELTGMKLTPVSIDTVAWRDWKAAHSDSGVLSQKTGYVRHYGRDPYGNYYEDSFVFFPIEASDDRVHPKTVVFGIEIDGIYKAYREDDLIELRTIEDSVNGINIKVERDNVGIVKITNIDTGEEIVKERDFWFAWYAFHPDTKLYEVEEPEPEITIEEPQVKEIEVIAKRFEFIPDPIVVNQGDKVKLKITSIDTTHGFNINTPFISVNKQLPPNQEVVVEFTATETGSWEFRCSVPCGTGHSGMRGTLEVE
jgi:plastocyanin